jgi:hypothetical protein
MVIGGCASVVNGQQQKIKITTTCNKNTFPAYCVAQIENNQLEFLTPYVINVNRSSNPITIICESSISGQYGVLVKSYPSIAFIGNLGIGGVAGMAIDSANSSMWQYKTDVAIEIPWCRF